MIPRIQLDPTAWASPVPAGRRLEPGRRSDQALREAGASAVVAGVLGCSGSYARRIVRGEAPWRSHSTWERVLVHLARAGYADTVLAMVEPYRDLARRHRPLRSASAELADVTREFGVAIAALVEDLADGHLSASEAAGRLPELEQLRAEVDDLIDVCRGLL